MFPSDEILKQKWINVLTRDGWSTNPQGRVCSVHFKLTEVLQNSSIKVQLMNTAVPSVLPPMNNASFATEPLSTAMKFKMKKDSNHILPSSKPRIMERIDGNVTRTLNTTVKNKFNVISELADDMKSIKSKISLHLRTRRAKNCRMRAKIEKLKRFLVEVKEESASNNPVLASLFENALKEPQNMEMDELLKNDRSSKKMDDDDILHQVEKFESIHEVIPKESYAAYLANEMKKLHPEDLILIKREVHEILEISKIIL